MRVFIVHTADGEIRSVVHAEVAPQEIAPVERPPGIPGVDEIVTEIPAEGIAVDKSPLEIHENYRFDVKRGKLVRKRQSARKTEGDEAGGEDG